MARSHSKPPNRKPVGRKGDIGEGRPEPPDPTARAAESNFRVYIGDEEVGVLSVSALHLVDARARDGQRSEESSKGRPTRSSRRSGEDAGAEPWPGLQRVILRRAVDGSRVFHNWQQVSRAGKPDLRTVSIVLLSAAGGDPLHRWELANARPVRWSGPALDALSGELAMEELEITYEYVEWI